MHRRILLVDDEDGGGALVRDILRNAGRRVFEVEWVRRSDEACARLAADVARPCAAGAPIDVVVLDLSLPDSAGIDTFDRMFRIAPRIPILVLCRADEEDLAKTAVTRGAQDFLLKDRIDAYSLCKAVHGMIDRSINEDALFEQRERAQVTLNSIADGVISTDTETRVTYLNAVAQRLTGWSPSEAAGRPIEEVFPLVDGAASVIESHPMALAIRRNEPVALAADCALIRRDGVKFAIEDSAAPIHDRHGRVSGAVMVFRDVTEARALSARMEHQARHDNLTNLANRASLTEQLVKAVALAVRNEQMIAVLFLDLDRLKNINDTLGHDIGDRLLKSVAERLRGSVRDSDTVCRYGGDEFAVLLARVGDSRDVAVCAEKILAQLRRPHRIDEHDLYVTVSIGIATCPGDGVDAMSLLKSADLAMYHAKSEGRDNFQFFRSEMNTRVLLRRSMDRDLRRALERRELSMLFQPTIDLATRAVTGVEALIRWRHPERGLLLPEQFLSYAEDCGQIVPIGRWALRTACEVARSWDLACIPPMRIAVNVSPLELRDREFVSGVRAILDATGLQPDRLMLELTETILVQDTESAARVLHEIKEMGVQIALDDFGTGFSSLSHLQRFPIDALKIDRSFLWNMTTDSNDAGIVGAIIGMADSLRMRVIAEGVENRRQLAVLQEQCCPEAQGYLFSRPLAAGELVHFLRRAQWTPLSWADAG